MRLYCATTNPGKLREFKLALSGSLVVEALPDFSSLPVCEETGATFEDNAIQKAFYYSKHCDGFLFVDDSGLEVDALAGPPGVYSARYAAPDATDEVNNRLLLDRMRGVPNRSARFICVVALAQSGRLVRTFRGEVAGHLTEEKRGTNGFGYDPLFYYPPFGCTFGEARLADKMKVSHRSQALHLMRDYVATLGK